MAIDSRTSHAPIDVLVRDIDSPTRWGLGELKAWRWLDQQAGSWEGCVDLGLDRESWFPGEHLRRVGGRSS